MAQLGHRVDALDFSPAMVERARAKLAGVAGVTVTEGDAYEPALPGTSYDVVLCRHVLWAMPEPSLALRRWVDLLAPGGRLVLVEGSWSTGAGLTAAETVGLVAATGREPRLTMLDDPTLWGGPTTDERYLVTS
jgi:SAM-dependent methyltransferase